MAVSPALPAYQYVKLGSNLEFLRGLATVSVIQTTSLAAFPGLMENLPWQRYSVLGVVNVIKSLLVQLEAMGLEQSLRTAEAFRPMLAEMEDFLARQPKPQLARLTDPFAERLVALSKVVGSAVRSELGTAGPALPSPAI
jgi:hypothetical protein